MSRLGLAMFDTTVQTTNEWLQDVEAAVGPDRQMAYRALRAVLHALRDRLTAEEAAELGDQLPVLVRGIYYDGWKPARQPSGLATQDEFLHRVGEELRDVPPGDVRDATRAVLAVLETHLDRGEIEQVRTSLPSGIQGLWPGNVGHA